MFMKRPPFRTARRSVWIAFGVLFLLHQDSWWWDDRTLVLGYLPIGMFYHILFSIAATVLWVFAIRWAWPDHIEEWATTPDAHAPAAVSPASPSPSERAPR